MKKQPLVEDYQLPEPDEPIIKEKTKSTKTIWLIFRFVFLLWGIPWIAIIILYYFPATIFDGKAFMGTDTFTVISIVYVTLAIIGVNYSSVKSLFRT